MMPSAQPVTPLQNAIGWLLAGLCVLCGVVLMGPGSAMAAGLGECMDLETHSGSFTQSEAPALSMWLSEQSTPEREAICDTMGWNCPMSEEDSSPVEEVLPCEGQDEEACIQSREDQDVSESFAADLFGDDESPMPLGAGLACYDSSAQCDALPARPSLEWSRPIIPTPSSLLVWVPVCDGWTFEPGQPHHEGLAACEGLPREIDQPPQAV